MRHFVPQNQPSTIQLADEKLTRKHLNYSRYILHQECTLSSQNGGAKQRRTSGLRISHQEKPVYLSNLDDDLTLKNSLTYKSSQC
jgi:hypothetical protein